jgi:hypothetical protein
VSGLDPRLLIAGDFIMLRMALVDALDGDIEAALVLQRIAWRCERDGFWKASHEDIQQETRLSERKVKGALKVLRDKGFLSARRATAYDATLVWSVLLDTDVSSVSEADETSVSPSTKTGETTIGDADAPPSLRQFALMEPTATKPVKRREQEEFDQWWAHVPRKVAKGQARKAWAGAVKKAGGAAILIDATRRGVGWNADREAKYQPYPATWLNGERWADEAPPTAQPTAGVWQPAPNKWSI